MPASRHIALLLVLTGCATFSPPETSETYTLDYPTDAVADLPNSAPGTVFALAVQVRGRRGQPAEGVEVAWSDGFVTPSVRPSVTATDSTGLARVQWTVRAPHPGQFGRPQVLRAYLPGANHSPLEYRVTVYTCSKNC